jgi:hypothetical protein
VHTAARDGLLLIFSEGDPQGPIAVKPCGAVPLHAAVVAAAQLLLLLVLLALLRWRACTAPGSCCAPAAACMLYQLRWSNTSRSSAETEVKAESAKLTMGNFMASLCVMLSCGGSALTDLQLPTYTVSAACSTTLKLRTPHDQQEGLVIGLQVARTPGRRKQYTAAVWSMVHISS